MAITRYTLRRPALPAWRDLDVTSPFAGLFDDGQSRLGANGGMWTPAVSVEEGTDGLLLTAELPGLTEDDISIELENHVLTLSGEKTEVRTEGEETPRYHLVERRYGSFRRSFTLPRTVNADEIRAHFEHGVLTVSLPKAAEAKGRKIEIGVA